MFGIDSQALSRPPKMTILTVLLENCEKLAVNHSIEKACVT